VRAHRDHLNLLAAPNEYFSINKYPLYSRRPKTPKKTLKERPMIPVGTSISSDSMQNPTRRACHFKKTPRTNTKITQLDVSIWRGE